MSDGGRADTDRLDLKHPVMASLEPALRRQFRLVLWITAAESFATGLIEFGIHFFTKDVFGFTPWDNLLVALAFGVAYFAGAQTSHRLEQRFGARRVYRASIVGQAVFLLALIGWCVVFAGPRFGEASPSVMSIALLNMGLSYFTGLKWPVVESYVTAGMTPRRASRAVGWFNLTWAGTVVLALLVSGPCIAVATRVPMIFVLSLLVAGWAMWASRGLTPGLPSLADDHPERLGDAALARTRTLVASSRWTMLAAYTMLFLLSPLLPEICGTRLGLPVVWATAFAAIFHACRLLAFGVFAFTVFWHGRVWVLVLGAVALPAGVVLTLLGETVLAVGLGQVCFGVATGVTYYAALYYALVAKNASVEAGGDHEGVIGVGLALGPAIGLAGMWWTPGAMLGTTFVAAPVLVACAGAALWALRRP